MAFIHAVGPVATLGAPTPAATSQLHSALKDCTNGALGFFGGVRIPSTLVAGSALASAFLYNGSKPENRFDRFLKVIQEAFAIYAFCLSITSIVTTTTSSTSLLLGKHDPMATDVYHFLKREFNFEFVLTRWSFLTSLFAFLISVSARILIEFRLLAEPKKRKYGAISALAMTSFISFLLSHVNYSLNCWASLPLMTVEVLQLVWARMTSKSRPLAMLSLVSIASAGLFALSLVWQDGYMEKNKED